MKYDNIKLPKNYPHLTTKQVLTAEWINGIPLTNKQTLLDQNYDLTLIMKQYIKLFVDRFLNMVLSILILIQEIYWFDLIPRINNNWF